MPDKPSSGPADYLALERTFLAWIRTGLAFMGLGFVVARFGLFLQQMQVGHPGVRVHPFGPSFWLGTTLIVLGVTVNIASALRHIQHVHDLNRGLVSFNRPSWLAVIVASLLALLGLAMATYLVFVRA